MMSNAIDHIRGNKGAIDLTGGKNYTAMATVYDTGWGSDTLLATKKFKSFAELKAFLDTYNLVEAYVMDRDITDIIADCVDLSPRKKYVDLKKLDDGFVGELTIVFEKKGIFFNDLGKIEIIVAPNGDGVVSKKELARYLDKKVHWAEERASRNYVTYRKHDFEGSMNYFNQQANKFWKEKAQYEQWLLNIDKIYPEYQKKP